MNGDHILGFFVGLLIGILAMSTWYWLLIIDGFKK